MSMKRILVRGPNWIGDHVMALNFFKGLRLHFAKARITLVSRVRANELAACYWDEFVVLGSAPSAMGPLQGRYDLAITLPSSVSAAWMLYRLKIPVRIGFAEPLASLFLTDSLPWPGRSSRKHKSAVYEDLLRWIGGCPQRHTGTQPGAPATNAQINNTVVVAPGASISLREWPFFAELILQLNQRLPDLRVVVVGQARDRIWANRFRRVNAQCEDRTGQTTLFELVALLQTAKLCIANDSGVAHLAAQGGCPVIALFGPGDPGYVAPQGRRVEVLRDALLGCSPCESARCRAPFGYQRCLRNVPPQAVIERVRRILD